MNYKLLFEMECEKHRQTEVELKRVLNDIDIIIDREFSKDKLIESLKYDIGKLEIQLSKNWTSKGEVQPKLHQRIITEIYC